LYYLQQPKIRTLPGWENASKKKARVLKKKKKKKKKKKTKKNMLHQFMLLASCAHVVREQR